MSDVRALLKAKRQEARISHPLASYTSSGQLKCIVCHTNIKHASAWEGHLGSKGHRTNAARLREEERLREQQEQEAKAGLVKRKAEETLDSELISKKQKTGSGPSSRSTASNFPSDFFSDPSQSLPPPPSDDSEEEHDDVKKPQEKLADSTIDQEWIRFQHTVINAPDERMTYDRATVFAEPQLVSRTLEGLPSTQKDVAQVEPEPELDEEGARWRKEQEERELIMDRLMDEERAQEEADMKVTMMKNKLEALRRKRAASRSAKYVYGKALSTVFFLLQTFQFTPCLWTIINASTTGRYQRLCWKSALACLSPQCRQNASADFTQMALATRDVKANDQVVIPESGKSREQIGTSRSVCRKPTNAFF